MAFTMKEMPDTWDMVRNILKSYYEASPLQVQEGMLWYDEAYVGCWDISESGSGWYDVWQVAGVLATVSPGLNWSDNESMPMRILDLHMRGVPASEWVGFRALKANLLKCERILEGDYTAIKGRKVQNFYSNIMQDTQSVTVDRWAMRIALDNPYLCKQKIIPSGKKVYDAFAEAYQIAAHIAGIQPRQMQAITWVYYRELHSGKTAIGARQEAKKTMEVMV